MNIYPAIDIKDGKCVRLVEGDFNTVHQVAEDPVEIARQYNNHGASMIHVVDLDGARDGVRRNSKLISEIITAAKPSKIELGGGLRTMHDLKEADDIGVERFIIGTAALDSDIMKKALTVYGERIAVGIDSRDGFVRVKGWEEATEQNDVTFALSMAELGVRNIIYTDISTDGTLSGPPLESLAKLRSALPETVSLIASGGVSALSDIRSLRKIGINAVIIGKALYSNNISLDSALDEADFGYLFDKQDLIPAIIQDSVTNEVLMLGYMSLEALGKTRRTKLATFWSRSRSCLWTKGETSGNTLEVKSIRVDCDHDTLLLSCDPAGPVCHTGERNCFYRELT